MLILIFAIAFVAASVVWLFGPEPTGRATFIADNPKTRCKKKATK